MHKNAESHNNNHSDGKKLCKVKGIRFRKEVQHVHIICECRVVVVVTNGLKVICLNCQLAIFSHRTSSNQRKVKGRAYF